MLRDLEIEAVISVLPHGDGIVVFPSLVAFTSLCAVWSLNKSRTALCKATESCPWCVKVGEGG